MLIARVSDTELFAPLPTLGSTNRMPSLWSDLEVRRLMLATHRQMTVESALATICHALGPDRTPSKSALARIWKRLDRRQAQGGAR